MPTTLLCAGTLDRITPHGVRMLRAMVNDSVLDVMYYMSQRFGPEVSMYVRVCACVHVCVVCVCVCVCVHVCVSTCVCMHTYAHFLYVYAMYIVYSLYRTISLETVALTVTIRQ